MFEKMKENYKLTQFEKLKEQYLDPFQQRVLNCNNEYFLNYLLNEMKGRPVEVTYRFGLITMKKQLNAEQIVLQFPKIQAGEWFVSVKALCYIEKKGNETLLVMATEWNNGTPQQTVTITFPNTLEK